MSRTGREMMLEWLYKEIRLAKTADLQRAAAFLEWARGIRKGCSKQEGWGEGGSGQCVAERRGPGCALVGLLCLSMLLCRRLENQRCP